MKTPETQFTEWREHFAKQREDLLAKRAEIDEQIAEIDRELEGIRAYEQVKAGKGYHPQPTERRPRASSGAPRKTRETGRRNEILDLLKKHPKGLMASQVAEKLGVTDQQGKQYIATTLSTLKTKKVLVNEGRGAPYALAEDAAPYVPETEGSV
jgi:hypothetical protein